MSGETAMVQRRIAGHVDFEQRRCIYLTWFEVARTEFMRQMGLTYRQWEQEGFYLPVVEAGCRYQHPAHYDDELELVASLTLDGVTFHFDYEVRRAAAGESLATGWTDHVCLGGNGRIDRAATRRLFELVRASGL